MKIEKLKFKAKRLDNGEWIYGSLIRSTAGIKERAYIVDSFSSMSDYSVVGVDPSTVCQFTGLKDCKGNEIWEGDIVNDNYDLLCINNLYEVVYREEEGTFAFKSLDKVDNYEPFVNLFEVYVVVNKFDKEK